MWTPTPISSVVSLFNLTKGVGSARTCPLPVTTLCNIPLIPPQLLLQLMLKPYLTWWALSPSQPATILSSTVLPGIHTTPPLVATRTARKTRTLPIAFEVLAEVLTKLFIPQGSNNKTTSFLVKPRKPLDSVTLTVILVEVRSVVNFASLTFNPFTIVRTSTTSSRTPITSPRNDRTSGLIPSPLKTCVKSSPS